MNLHSSCEKTCKDGCQYYLIVLGYLGFQTDKKTRFFFHEHMTFFSKICTINEPGFIKP